MGIDKLEFRFKTVTPDGIECEVFATIVNDEPAIQTVNVIGDCVVTMDDLDEDTKHFLLAETKRVLSSHHRA